MCFYFRSALKFQHVNPDEAVQIHQDVRSKKSFAMHWGTFDLSVEVGSYFLIQGPAF